MTRLGNKLSSTVIALLASASLLAGCGGGGSHVTALPQAAATQAPAYTGPLSSATFTITIPPPPKPSSNQRRPSYVSSSTSKIVFTLNSASALTPSQVTSVNTSSLGSMPVTLNSSQCPGSGPWTCTLTIKLPPGTDNLTIAAEDSSSNILSQQIQTFTVTAGGSASGANKFTTTLDANVATMTITGSGFCAVGTVANASTFGSVGTSPVTFTMSYTDPSTAVFNTPVGKPTLEVGDGTTYQTTSGTLGSGSTGVSFTVDQSNQQFTVTPNSTSASQTVYVKAVPRNTNGTSDGLGFAPTTHFTFTSGTAPPVHNFLAAIEQTGANSGKIDLYNLTLGVGSGSADSFLPAYSPATLAVTGSTNQPGVSDVDNPLAIAWDANGDLLIANGGSGAAADPNGNFACVPVGSIATGSAQSTTVTTNVDVPESLAYGTHGTVGLADSAGTTIAFSEFALTGNYVPADSGSTGSGTPNLTISEEGGDGGTFTVALPTLSGSSDTFAVSLYGGPTHTPKVTIVASNGTTTDLTDPAISIPVGLAWDGTNNELVIANNDGSHTDVLTYTVSPVAQKQVINTSLTNYYVAASPDGHLAVAGASFTGTSVVQIYTSAATGRTLLSTIPFNTTTTSNGATYIYSPGTITSMSWLSATKLMISLNARNTVSNNGIYIFDISASQSYAGYDDITGNPPPNGPKQTGFQVISKQPLGTAFKP